MPEEHFDTAGFFFFMKLLFGLVVLVGMASLGTSVFADRAFAPETVSKAEVAEARGVAADPSVPENILSHVPERGKFIGADLAAMKLYMFEDGAETRVLSVISAGELSIEKEVPPGRYAVEGKVEDFLKDLEESPQEKGPIHLPWSIEFSENLFIHGSPYGQDGVPVGDAGVGYIRLSAEDAETLFHFTEIGTPMFMSDTEQLPVVRHLSPLAVSDRAVPATTARAYLVADIETGEVLAAKNERLRRSIASVTKLMTAVVAQETLVYNRNVMVPSIGRRYLVDDLYYPLFLRSDNEVAEAIAGHQSRAVFLAAMNTKARSLGMRNTRYVDASGLSAKNVSTVSDLFALAQYLYSDEPGLLEISRTERSTIRSLDGANWAMTNQNQFAKADNFVGGKLGFTSAALQTSLGIFDVTIAGETRTVAVIILGSYDWKEDTRQLLAWTARAVRIAGE